MQVTKTENMAEKPFRKVETVSVQKEIEVPELEYFEFDDIMLDDDHLMLIKGDHYYD